MQTASIKWDPPVERTDDKPLGQNDIANIDVFDLDAPGAPIGTVPGAGAFFQTGDLTVGEHAFVVIVTDTLGNKSAASSPPAIVNVAPPVVVAPPKPATNVTATLDPPT